MNFELSGKVVLVTGSSAGIGLAIARGLASEGATVVLNGRDPARLAAAAAELHGAFTLVADVRDPAACGDMVDQLLARYGRLDGLVCNVGSGASVPPGQETTDEWRSVLELNLHTATQTVWAASDALVASQGSVVYIKNINILDPHIIKKKKA